jgi:hypothetical protein
MFVSIMKFLRIAVLALHVLDLMLPVRAFAIDGWREEAISRVSTAISS